MRISVHLVRILFALLVFLFVYSLFGRKLHVDDAWLGEHAWYQSKLGYVKSELMSGVTRQEERVLIHHKLLTLSGSLAIGAAGFSAPVLKSVSLIYFLMFIGLSYWYLVRRRAWLNKDEYLVFLLLLSACPLVFDLAFVFRPEIPMMFFGFLGFIFLYESVTAEKHAAWLAVGAGAAAGLCFDFHLNGLIFVASGFILLLLRKRYGSLPAFIAGCILTGGLYFYDFNGSYGLSFWFSQIEGSPFHAARTAGYFNWKTIFLSLFTEHLRFFHSAVESSFSLMALVIIAAGWRSLRKMPVLASYTLLLIAFLAVLSLYKTSKYMVVYLPFIMMMIVLILKDRSFLRTEGKRLFIHVLPLCFILLYLGIAVWFDVSLSRKKFTSSEHHAITENYFRHRSKQKRIVAPMEFVFDEIGNYRGIQSLLLYSERLKTDSSYYGSGLLAHMRANGIDAACIDREGIRSFGLQSFREGAVVEGYRVAGIESGWLVLDRAGPAEKRRRPFEPPSSNNQNEQGRQTSP